jgi:hypothetical protein
MNLELDTFEYEEDTSIGTIQIEQVENSTKIMVEFFPIDQSKESFESAEFCKVYDILELAPYHDYNLRNFPLPEGTTEDQLNEVSLAIFNGVDNLLETILNIQDFKDVQVHVHGKDVPVYPVLEEMRKNYLLTNIMYFITYRATEYIDIEDVASQDVKGMETIFKITDTLNETDEQRTKNVLKYLGK